MPEAIVELESLRPWLTNVHVFAWNERRERFALGEAAAFWRPILERLAQWPNPPGGRRSAMIEFVAGDDAAAFLRDAATLKEWMR